jgi:hypothetical protein
MRRIGVRLKMRGVKTRHHVQRREMIKWPERGIFGGDVVRRGGAGSHGSDGASPYLRPFRVKRRTLNGKRCLRWGDDCDLDPFSRPGMFQYFCPILQREFVSDDFVHFDLTALKVG